MSSEVSADEVVAKKPLQELAAEVHEDDLDGGVYAVEGPGDVATSASCVEALVAAWAAAEAFHDAVLEGNGGIELAEGVGGPGLDSRLDCRRTD